MSQRHVVFQRERALWHGWSLSPSKGARKNRVADNPQNDKAKHAQRRRANPCDKFVPIKIVNLPYILATEIETTRRPAKDAI